MSTDPSAGTGVPASTICAGAESGKAIAERLAAILFLMAVAVLAFLPTVKSLLVEWEDTDQHTYTHGYLVAALNLWLLFRIRNDLAAIAIRPLRVVCIPLLAITLISVIVQRAGIEIGHQLLLPVAIWLALLAAFGWQFSRLCTFPIGYLYFAIPIWSHFNGLLQNLTITAVRILLRATAIPAYFAGDFVQVPSGTFEIADGCSGLHFLIVALALAALYGELQGDGVARRVRHLALAGVLAIAGNWIRVYVIIVAGHLTDMQGYLVAVDHYYFGWVVFAIAMGIFFFLAGADSRLVDSSSAAVQRAGEPRPPMLPAMILTGLALSIVPVLARLFAQESISSPLVELPRDPGGWRGPEAATGEWKPLYEGADAEFMGHYRVADRQLDLYVASYTSQHQGKELIGYRNDVLPRMRDISMARSSWAELPLNEYVAADAKGDQWLVWHTYLVGERVFASGAASELWYGFRSLTTMPESRVVALRTPCEKDCSAARAALADFLEHAAVLPGRSNGKSAL